MSLWEFNFEEFCILFYFYCDSPRSERMCQ